jgi:quercetin dioxygenase-like cupin family protein
MKIVRLYSDSSGESHWQDIEVDFTWQDFAPPAKPLGASQFTNAKTVGFIQGEVGWVGDWHPVPQRQYMFTLQGTAEVTTSDGEKRLFPAGTGGLVEDTTGKGHHTRVIGDSPMIMIVATLDD